MRHAGEHDDGLDFIWDTQKAWTNLRKHKVSFEEAESVFYDDLSTTKLDPEHSFSESRFLTLGLSSRQRLLLVAHADEGDKIRIISARQPTQNERYDYENG